MDVGNLLLVCLLSALPGPPGVTVDDGYIQLYPVDKTKCPTIDPIRDISYELYTSENPIQADMLVLNDDRALSNSHFDFHKPTVIFFHAFFESSTSLTATTIKTAYLQRKDHNVILLNAPRMEAGPWYLTAARNTRVVGEYTATFIDYLVSRGLRLPSLHLIGLSLGAQMAGVCGQNVKSGRIRRITGLDPAGPLFTKWPRSLKLDRGDAEFVDVIHTDAGIFGYPRSIGHVDFWPNRGISPQPGCGIGEVKTRSPDGVLEKFFCSHWRSYMFYAESVLTPDSFLAITCKNWNSFAKGNCDQQNQRPINMGFNVNPEARGNYFLTTRRASPFSLQTAPPKVELKPQPLIEKQTFIELPLNVEEKHDEIQTPNREESVAHQNTGDYVNNFHEEIQAPIPVQSQENISFDLHPPPLQQDYVQETPQENVAAQHISVSPADVQTNEDSSNQGYSDGHRLNQNENHVNDKSSQSYNTDYIQNAQFVDENQVHVEDVYNDQHNSQPQNAQFVDQNVGGPPQNIPDGNVLHYNDPQNVPNKDQNAQFAKKNIADNEFHNNAQNTPNNNQNTQLVYQVEGQVPQMVPYSPPTVPHKDLNAELVNQNTGDSPKNIPGNVLYYSDPQNGPNDDQNTQFVNQNAQNIFHNKPNNGQNTHLMYKNQVQHINVLQNMPQHDVYIISPQNVQHERSYVNARSKSEIPQFGVRLKPPQSFQYYYHSNN